MSDNQLNWLPEDIIRDARVSISLDELQSLLEKYAGLHLNFDEIQPTDGFGVRVRALREKHQMTTAELGKKINVASSTLRHWEHGSGNPSFRYITSLAEVFNIAPAQLFPQVPIAKKLGVTLPEAIDDVEVTNSIEASSAKTADTKPAARVISDDAVTESIESVFKLDHDGGYGPNTDDDDDFIRSISGDK